MKSQNIDNLLKQGFESIGAEVLEIINQEVTEITAIGRLPNTACILTINAISDRNGKKEDWYRFTINGQVTFPEILGLRIRSDGWFHNITRCFYEHEEYYGKRVFSICHHEQCNSKIEKLSIEERIKAGIKFFKDFLSSYGDILEEQFTEKIFMPSGITNIFPKELLKKRLLISEKSWE